MPLSSIDETSSSLQPAQNHALPRMTIVLPIRERTQYLERFLRFHCDCPVIVVDSSRDSHAEMVKPFSHAEYHWFGPYNHFEKIDKALSRVKTDYVLIANDDDFFIASGIRACIAVMERTPSAVCVHGANVNFEMTPVPNIKFRNHKTFVRNHKIATRPVRDTTIGRFDTAFSYLCYGAYNGVFRTPVLREIIPSMIRYGFDPPGLNDFGFSLTLAMFGDYLGTRELYCLRDLSSIPVRDLLKIPMVNFWDYLLANENRWSDKVDVAEIRRRVPEWKGRITRQARIETALGRYANPFFAKGAYKLMKTYRDGDALLQKTIGRESAR